jgi:SAM-dependent methyltransferase
MTRDMAVQTETLDALAYLDHYNTWLIDRIRPYVGRRVLEVGSGIGNMAHYFLDRELVITSDVEPEYRETLAKRFAEKTNVIVADFSLDSGNGKEDLAAHRLDTVICVNVLEHIEDDRRAVRHMTDLLVPGGRLVVLVPALPFLYGSLDRALHHFRRYRRNELAGVVTQAGLRVDALFYFNFFGIFGWFVNARILRKEILPADQLRLFDRLAPTFRSIETALRPPIGQSLIIAATKSR